MRSPRYIIVHRTIAEGGKWRLLKKAQGSREEMKATYMKEYATKPDWANYYITRI